MNLDFRTNPRVKYIESKNVADLFLNNNNTTATIFKKFYENGHEIISGFFVSKRKLGENEIAQNTEGEIYLSNNQIKSEPKNANNIDELMTNMHQTRKLLNKDIKLLPKKDTQTKFDLKEIVKSFLFLTILVILVLFMIDLGYYFSTISKENEYEKRICIKEYLDHSCGNITIEDGPILIEYCKEREKCLDENYQKVFFHTVITRFFKDIFSNIFSGVLNFNSINICYSILIVLVLLIINKLL